MAQPSPVLQERGNPSGARRAFPRHLSFSAAGVGGRTTESGAATAAEGAPIFCDGQLAGCWKYVRCVYLRTRGFGTPSTSDSWDCPRHSSSKLWRI